MNLACNTYADLRKYRAGVTSGYSYTEALWTALNAFKNYQEAPTDFQNVRKLVAGRIDYFPCDLANCIFLSKGAGYYDSITFVDHVIVEKSYYTAFSKASRYPGLMNVARRYRDYLKAFMHSAEFRTITEKYLK